MALLSGYILTTLVILQVCFFRIACSYDNDGDEPIPSEYYALEIRGGKKLADMVASAHGFKVVREVSRSGLLFV